MQNNDPELMAMGSVLSALSPLDRDAQERVLDWVASKLGLQEVREVRNIPDTAVNRPLREGTINTVCSRLGVKSCRDLFRAAAIHLSLYQGKDRFSRSDWVTCAKEAKCWKSDYSVQMATTITRLHNSGFVDEIAKDVYCVPDNELRAIEAKLA
jgi:hypothetical protein